MTSFRLSELPTPYRSAGASPLGTHEGTVTPPEPPTPPTPTITTYFSGATTNVTEQDGMYIYMFGQVDDPSAEEFFAKQVGDELSVTINGTAQTMAITIREEGEEGDDVYADVGLGELTPQLPVIWLAPGCYGGTWSYGSATYISLEEISGGVTLVIADPS